MLNPNAIQRIISLSADDVILVADRDIARTNRGRTDLYTKKIRYSDLLLSLTSDLPAAVWGSITGTLSGQTDLQSALNAKLSLTGGTLTGDLTVETNLTVDGYTKAHRPFSAEEVNSESPLTLDLSHVDSLILASNSNSENTGEISIPRDSSVNMPLGTEIDFLQYDVGTIRIKAGDSVTLNGITGGYVETTAQWAGASLKKILRDRWIIVGKITDVA